MLSALISKKLNIDEDYIIKVAKRSKYYYKHYKIPKKNGGERDIYHPSPILKNLQYWLIDAIFVHMPVTEYATAYQKGCSIAKNASHHLMQKHILHLDIKDFFPSIKSNHIEYLMEKNKEKIKEKLGFELSTEDKEFILRTVLRGGSLVIGSVSAPILCNLIMFDADTEIAECAKRYDCVYTRYADDLVFSSIEFIPLDIVNDLGNLLRKYGFILNNNKMFFMGTKSRKLVTGVNVNNERLTIGREKRDMIKRMVYLKCKNGVGDRNKILGYLNYLKSIDPWYYNRIIIKYPEILNLLKI